jgi:hypothetical protein
MTDAYTVSPAIIHIAMIAYYVICAVIIVGTAVMIWQTRPRKGDFE